MNRTTPTIVVLTIILCLGTSLGWAQSREGQAGTAEQSVITPTPVPEFSPELSPKTSAPTLSDTHREQLERILRHRQHRPGPPLPEGPPPDVAPPNAVPPTIPRNMPVPTGGPQSDAPQSFAPSQFVLSVTPMGVAAPSGFKSVTNEPTADGFGNVIVQSGNWYLAASTNGGQSFSFIDPFGLMSGVDDGFCCDQIVTYDRSRDLLFVMLMSVSSATTKRNTLRLFVVRGLRSGTMATFSYDLTPSLFGFGLNKWLDFPKLVVGRNHLYLTANVYGPAGCEDTACVFDKTFIARLSLNGLRDGVGFAFDFFQSTLFNFTVAEGIGNVAYWASHNSTSSLRIFSWSDDSPTVFFFDRTVPTWSAATRSCPGPDGRDWCGRDDERILGAYLRDRSDRVDGKELGFMWSSGSQPGSGRPMPYVRVARFAVTGMVLLDTPDIWATTFAFLYPYAAPNVSGGLGVSLFSGGGPFFPTHNVCISDDLNALPPPWECVGTIGSTQGPTTNNWGDYVTVRTHWPRANTWRATGYALSGGGSGNNVRPVYIEFGRGRDLP